MTYAEESTIAAPEIGEVASTLLKTMEAPVRIPVVEGQKLNSGIRVFVGSIPVKYLLRIYTVPYRDSIRKEGYQRKPQEARISRFATSLRKHTVDVPTSILLNIRDVGVSDVIKFENGGAFLSIDEELGNPRLYVVDGQHRVEAFRKLCEDDAELWSDYKLQFVLMVGAPEIEELNQFYVVNTEAKSVRTDLAYDLLKQRTESDSRVLEETIARGQDWRLSAQAIVDDMNASSFVWKSMIRLANADKGNTTIPSASFVSSLRPLLMGSPFFQTLNREQRVKVLSAFWQGVRLAMREPFDGEKADYSLQKGIGVAAMHEVLVNVIELVRMKGGSVFDQDAYVEIMEPVLMNLEADNVSGDTVRGADFWFNAKLGGAAGSFSSSAGKRVLFAKLRTLLPAITVE